MNLDSHFPSNNPYRPYIKKTWVLENTSSFLQKQTGPLIGDGRFELIFVTGNGYRTLHPQTVHFFGEGIYIGGHISESFELEILPNTRLTFVKLEPWTVSLLSGFNFQASINQTIPLEVLNRPLYQQFKNVDWENNQQVLFELLGKGIADGLSRHKDFQLLYEGCQLLESQYDDFKQGKQQLLRHSSLSSRSIEQKFKRYIGLTPKKFANTIRLRKIVEDVFFDLTAESLTQTALKHGYYDQAHFIRDCKQLLGFTPKNISFENCFVTHPDTPFRYYTI